MRTARQIADRAQALRSRNAKRDADYMRLIAIRKGDYDTVAPGLFNTKDFPKPLVANLVDTTARDIAEVMAPLPALNCNSASLSNATDQDRQDLREAIANGYVQHSRLQDQMFGGADRYGSFGFMAYIVEPDFDEQMPCIRIADVPTASYAVDYRGRCREYLEAYKVPVEQLKADFPEYAGHLDNRYGKHCPGVWCEVIRYYDAECTALVLLDPCVTLVYTKNRTSRCNVRIIERPSVTGEVRGQFDDVIWVQVGRALVQMYTMEALEQSVNAPVVVPKDVQELELGPYTVIQTDNPQGAGRMNLQLAPGLFPEQQILAQEQRTGSRYPEGRSGSIDASIITGQGVQALMGTFDTQVQTFQRLNASALEDVIELCFQVDEAYFGGTKKSRRIRDNGTSRKYTYTPAKDIDGDYTVDVSYGAIAGLDPNRGLVFILQALAGGLIAKETARKSLPVDLNAVDEERQIQLEAIDDSVTATLAMLPQAIPQMAMMGQDPREVALQTVQVRKLVQGGKSVAEAMEEVFAPKEEEAAPEQPAAPAMPAAPEQGGGPASDLLMSLTGLTPSGKPNMQANVSRSQPI